MADQLRQDKDLVLSPWTYAFVLDETKGVVNIWVGPAKTSLSNTDKPIEWTGKRFNDVNLDQAIKPFVQADENEYVILTNPAEGHPKLVGSQSQEAQVLATGKKIVIPGPAAFALWPGQKAEVISGHKLASNEYLVARVYEPTAARENAEKTIAEKTAGETKGADLTEKREFTMGERIIVRGDEYSYYVPPTGIEVVPTQDDESGKRTYVRRAVSLEQLEYCVLLDENGDKRYQRGPKVVFPRPTEEFKVESGDRKFRPIELDSRSGIYIKVTAGYPNDLDSTLDVLRGASWVEVEPTGEIEEGDELFLTGEHIPIYFPRTEHLLITYGEQRKHYATAVPRGKARYVMDKETGEVQLIEGPTMLLIDPRRSVMVRRVLDAGEVSLMFPSSPDAEVVNAQWRTELASAGETFLTMNYAGAAAGTPERLSQTMKEAGALSRTSKQWGGDKIKRSTTYTEPHHIQLDDKYEGAVHVQVYNGYAVLVMDKVDNRRVIKGPANVLLAYDESLGRFSLSTGKPKTTDKLHEDVYLRVINNQVSDVVTVESRDMVPVQIKVSYLVDFEGDGDDQLKWFNIENYVKLLTDRCRSRLRGEAKQYSAQDLISNTHNIVRDHLLGQPGDGGRIGGLAFQENGMRLTDVEVLQVLVGNENVASLLGSAMQESLTGDIELSQARQRAERDAELNRLTREQIKDEEKTLIAQAVAALASIDRRAEQEGKQIEIELAAATERRAITDLQLEIERSEANQERELRELLNSIELARANEEAEIFAKRVAAASPELIGAINHLGDAEIAARVMEKVAASAAAMGITTADFIERYAGDVPLFGELARSMGRRQLGS